MWVKRWDDFGAFSESGKWEITSGYLDTHFYKWNPPDLNKLVNLKRVLVHNRLNLTHRENYLRTYILAQPRHGMEFFFSSSSRNCRIVRSTKIKNRKYRTWRCSIYKQKVVLKSLISRKFFTIGILHRDKKSVGSFFFNVRCYSNFMKAEFN